MFTSLETLLPTTLRKEDIVLALLPHPPVFGRRVSLPLQQRAANSALAISCTWSSLPPASVSPCPAMGGGLCRQSRQVLFRGALPQHTDIGVVMPQSQGHPQHFSWPQHCSAATHSKISSLQVKGKRKMRTPHPVVLLCGNPPGKHRSLVHKLNYKLREGSACMFTCLVSTKIGKMWIWDHENLQEHHQCSQLC